MAVFLTGWFGGKVARATKILLAQVGVRTSSLSRDGPRISRCPVITPATVPYVSQLSGPVAL